MRFMARAGSCLAVVVGVICLNCVCRPALAFGPCSYNMPQEVSYLPEVPACGGNAAVIVRGRYYNAFSIVVRDCNNNDRDPCHTDAQSCGTNQSSPFKTQKVVVARVLRNRKTSLAKIHCLKERGSSEVYKLVRRITIKLRNPARSPYDIAKICLRTRTIALHPVEIISVLSERKSPLFGYSAVCSTQGYLNCSIAYADICPNYQ